MSAPENEIAVVDDDESFSRAISRFLRAVGFQVANYPSGEAFLAANKTTTPACLVLDIHMAGMSGLDLQEQLRSEGKRIPAIFVTAHDEAEVCERTRELSCAAYFRKPVNGKILIEAIRKVISESRTSDKATIATGNHES